MQVVRVRTRAHHSSRSTLSPDQPRLTSYSFFSFSPEASLTRASSSLLAFNSARVIPSPPVLLGKFLTISLDPRPPPVTCPNEVCGGASFSGWTRWEQGLGSGFGGLSERRDLLC